MGDFDAPAAPPPVGCEVAAPVGAGRWSSRPDLCAAARSLPVRVSRHVQVM